MVRTHKQRKNYIYIPMEGVYRVLPQGLCTSSVDHGSCRDRPKAGIYTRFIGLQQQETPEILKAAIDLPIADKQALTVPNGRRGLRGVLNRGLPLPATAMIAQAKEGPR